MSKVIYKLTIQYEWQKKMDNSVSEYSFGSLEGAREFINEQGIKTKIIWYSIMGIDWIPCDKDNPGGQLYGGMIHHEYHNLTEENETFAGGEEKEA